MKRFFTILAGLCVPLTASAVSITDYQWTCEGFLWCGNGGGGGVVAIISTNIIESALSLVSVVAIAGFIYGGLRMAMSQGEEGKQIGKKALMYSALGLGLIVLTASGNRIIMFVLDLIKP